MCESLRSSGPNFLRASVCVRMHVMHPSSILLAHTHPHPPFLNQPNHPPNPSPESNESLHELQEPLHGGACAALEVHPAASLHASVMNAASKVVVRPAATRVFGMYCVLCLQDVGVIRRVWRSTGRRLHFDVCPAPSRIELEAGHTQVLASV